MKRLLAIFLLAAGADAAQSQGDADLRDRRPYSPRAAWDALEGQPAPSLGGLVEWQGAGPLAWEDLRGHVVLVVFWQSLDPGSTEALAYLADLADRYRERGLIVLALHDEKLSTQRERFLKNFRLPFVHAVDAGNTLRSAFARNRKPTVHAVGRDGQVGIAGVRPGFDQDGATFFERAVRELLARPWEGPEPSLQVQVAPGNVLVPPPVRVGPPRTPEETEEADPKPRLNEDGWPLRIPKDLYAGRDLRGRKAPPLQVEYWVTDEPELAGRPLLLYLFSTVSHYSKAFCPDIERIRAKFGDELAVVALSEQAYDRDRYEGHPWLHTVPEFFAVHPQYRFHVAVDGQGRMHHAVNPKVLPQVLLIGTDGVVRWQGYPGTKKDPLTPKLVRAFLKREARRRAAEEAEEKKEPGGGGGDD